MELQPDDEAEEQQQLEGDSNELEGNNDNLDIQDIESQEQMGGDEAEFSQDNNLINLESKIISNFKFQNLFLSKFN